MLVSHCKTITQYHKIQKYKNIKIQNAKKSKSSIANIFQTDSNADSWNGHRFNVNAELIFVKIFQFKHFIPAAALIGQWGVAFASELNLAHSLMQYSFVIFTHQNILPESNFANISKRKRE